MQVPLQIVRPLVNARPIEAIFKPILQTSEKFQCLSCFAEKNPATFRVGRGYTLNMWTKLRRCFDYAEVELSNNLAENSMRPVALGRKNWLHVGSKEAGPKVATILSVIEWRRRLGISAQDYFLDILSGMSRRKLSEVTNLSPSRWALARD